jgi:hypothetical protein
LILILKLAFFNINLLNQHIRIRVCWICVVYDSIILQFDGIVEEQNTGVFVVYLDFGSDFVGKDGQVEMHVAFADDFGLRIVQNVFNF